MTHPFSVTVRIFVIIITLLPFTSHAFAEEQKYRRTVESYTVPNVVLVNQNGTKVRLNEILHSGKPVIIEFVFTTCTTICPVLSVSFVNLQHKLGNDSQKVQLVSISIDPENDTPKVMKEYLKRYQAKPGWDFLTGSRKDIDAVMHAFNAYIPNKMYHIPLTLMKKGGAENQWVRIYGLMSSSEFVNEFNNI